ncbi:uncharacterized protein LOC126851291 isoform X3 [Cataglyphis hispanica]|uniref:uncharacterized protein LOC126851291 isoform X3 n=1 Tax=Cataglyphis hispanica TaxID=1086592 RepID=UPI00217FD545|nr:uncharacterized protein LOC126851291 isoform X3 [Cataglyphis hispanica]
MSRERYAGDIKGTRISTDSLSPPGGGNACPMCHERFDAARGCDPPRVDRSSRRCGRILRVLLLSGMLLGQDARDVYKILGGVRTHQADYDYMNNDVKDAGNQGDDLYIGHSGDPWSASSTNDYNKNIYMSSQLNKTRIRSIARRDKETTATIGHTRFKRGVFHLYNMVVCATGCNPLAYKGYGCYCGFLGSGYVIDGIDQCCKMHDWCYDATECLMFSEYFVPYYWRCYHGYKPVCAVEHGSWGGSGSCAQRLCECDRSLAECLKKYPCPTTKAVCTSSPWRLVQNLFMII